MGRRSDVSDIGANGGAVLPSSAVLTSKGRMLTQEQDGNDFAYAWNKSCTVSGGDEIADLVKRLGII